MKKLFGHYIISKKEMDEINYLLDSYKKYKVLAELDWDKPEVRENEEIPDDSL